MTHKTSRIEAIDATRGTAMLLVFLSHFGLEYFRDVSAEKTTMAIHLATMTATPTFMIISGMILGYLFHAKRDSFPTMRQKLLDRGLFFFLVGHFLIALAYTPINRSFSRAFQSLFITDVIGLCLVIVPCIITKLGPAARVIVGLLGYIACWAIILEWSPQGTIAPLLKQVIFGVREGLDTAVLWYSFSFLPWLCLYLSFTAAGERLAVHVAAGSRGSTERYVARLAGSCLAFSLLFSMTFKAAKNWVVIPAYPAVRTVWMTIYQKTPPGPIFVLFYGGIGIAILYLLLRFGAAPWMHRYFSFSESLGQVSFFVYILQYFVYESFIYSLHPKFLYLWPPYFIMSVIFINTAARFWLRKNWNRFFSLRYIWRLLHDQARATAPR